MTAFVPQRPVPPAGRSRLAVLRAGLRSGIALFLDGSYGTVKVGRHAIRTFPRAAVRWLYTLRDPELIREVMVRRREDFPKAAFVHATMKPLMGESIVTTDGAVWRRNRRMVDPSLAHARVREVFPLMAEAVADSARRLERDVDAAARTGAPVAVDVEMTLFTADVIFRTIFSEPLLEQETHRFIEAIELFQKLGYAHGFLRLAHIPVWLLPGAWRSMAAARFVRGRLKRHIGARMAQERSGAASPRKDILSSLIAARDEETGAQFTETELLDQVAAMFVAGHETTAAALAFALYLLAGDQEVQARLRAQAEEVHGGRPPAFDDVRRLTLARDVFRETLRLYPSISVVARDCPHAQKLGDRDIQAGSILFISPWLVHRNATLWDRPDAFDPDRFDTENGRQGLRQAYLPFGLGPRVCIGAAFSTQEATMMLSELVRRFHFRPAAGHTPDPVSRITLRSANGVSLMVERRAAA